MDHSWRSFLANVARELPHLIMERRMLLGIRECAERNDGAGQTQEREGAMVP